MTRDEKEQSVKSVESAPARMQDVRGYLREVRDAFRRTEVLCTRAERYRELLTRATGQFDSTGKVKRPDLQEEYLVRLVDTHKELKKEIDRLLNRSREAEKLILMLENERHRVVLQLRYLCALEWEEVAKRLSYTIRWVHKLHREALEELERLPSLTPPSASGNPGESSR